MTVEGLTHEQLATFDREGMLCIPDYLTAEQIGKMMNRSHELLEEFDVESHPKTRFTTGEDHLGDQYFFDSADKVSFFFDADAFDKDGKLKYPKHQAINKIGHGLHMKERIFADVTLDAKVKAIAKSLCLVQPQVLQSMLIFKQPINDNDKERENSVPPHTDGAFLFTKPHSAVGFWFALEDCTLENGCLSYNPGTHKTRPITTRFVKVEGGDKGCAFVAVETDIKDEHIDKAEDYKAVECKAGSLILIHNSVLHKSENNRSKKSRFAYAFHLIDGVAEYDNLNWLQVPPCKEGSTKFTSLF